MNSLSKHIEIFTPVFCKFEHPKAVFYIPSSILYLALQLKIRKRNIDVWHVQIKSDNK